MDHSTPPLIGAADLARVADGVLLLDVRWSLQGPPGRGEYAKGHLPGARYIDLETELAGPVGPGTGRHPLPQPAELERVLRRLGVGDDSHVVAYDDAGGLSAARCWWVLRWAGLRRVQVLDGGLASWSAAGLPLTAVVPPDPPPGTVRVRPGSMPTLSADRAADLPGHGVLLDARAAERFRGEHEPIDPKAGHIPGAVSAPTTENLGPDGRFLPPAGLAARFAALGVAADRPVGVYCGSGVTAAHHVLALATVGIDAALYPGSWSQWSADDDRPVATGP